MNILKKWLNKRKGRREYSKKLMSFLSDHRLDSSEKEELEAVMARFELIASDILGIQKKAFTWLFNMLAADNRITIEEKDKFEDLALFFERSLSELGFDQERFNKAHILAQIEAGTLPAVQLDGTLGVVLKKGETLHWACGATFMKRKRVPQRVGYRGISASIKIMKGVKYRVGSFNVGFRSSQVLQRDDAGILWLTSQRIGFKGPHKHFSVPYKNIGSFEIAEGTLQIFKEGRENPYLICLSDYDVPCSILSLIVNSGTGV